MVSGVTVTELIGFPKRAWREGGGGRLEWMRAEGEGEGEEGPGALAENQGLVFFFLLLPKVLLLPSVTLAKN